MGSRKDYRPEETVESLQDTYSRLNLLITVEELNNKYRIIMFKNDIDNM